MQLTPPDNHHNTLISLLEIMMKIKASIRILSKSLLDRGFHAIHHLLGQTIWICLGSLQNDSTTNKEKLSSKQSLSLWGGSNEKEDTIFILHFSLACDFGRPCLILLNSDHDNEFFLKSINLEMPDKTNIYFPCFSWINHSRLYFNQPRVFFTNEPYIPNKSPIALSRYRQSELIALQGDHKGERVYGQRIYDYDFYNDMGNPDENLELRRNILGGSNEYPYPRRCRTGRKRTKNGALHEQPMTSFDGMYLPRDERFSALKKDIFVNTGLQCMAHNVNCVIGNFVFNNRSFAKLEHIYGLYVKALQQIPTFEILPEVTRKPSNGTQLKFPRPGIIQVNKEAWKLDEEFGRQRLAGLNPMVIRCLKSFPPESCLDLDVYGDLRSSIVEDDIEPFLEGHSVKEAQENDLLYILDYHDELLPFISRINELDGKTYASRTILYLGKNGKLVPIAIELTLPPEEKGAKPTARVFTPRKHPEWIWHLAKTHVLVMDTGYHQLINHWLRTHACIEPIIIATRRQLSIMHPVHKLLSPHFKDTLHINALARSSLINAGGKIECHYSAGKYCMEISSAVYKSWRFDEQALPKDLLKRGMAVEDKGAKHGLRLKIKDYPYAGDGLDVWAAIRRWVGTYVGLYYEIDEEVQGDEEIQAWWREVREVGHADHAEASWWPSMNTIPTLSETLTTIIWLASAHHAAVNFGQYHYAGFMPNSPAMARKLIPDEDSPEYSRILSDPDAAARFYLDMVPTQRHSAFAMAILEMLSQHASEEEYLGERKDPQWTSDERAVAALQGFREELEQVEAAIEARNAAHTHLHHRAGAIRLPYTLLAPSGWAGPGLTFRGIPNSISI